MASRVFLNTLRGTETVPSALFDWDSYSSRTARYNVADGLYTETVYSEIHQYARLLKENRSLYKFIRSFNSPVHRLVEFYVSAVYGGSLDFDTLERGAVPIMMADNALKEAIRTCWLWSNWRSNKNLYVRTGARYGDVFLWIADDPERSKAWIEVLHPSKVTAFKTDAVGNIKSATIEYQKVDENDKPYDFKLDYDDVNDDFYEYHDNREVASWHNPYGFYPATHTKHRDVGMQSGAYAFHGFESRIHEINEAASLLNDAVRKSVVPVYYGAGVQKQSELEAPNEARDKVPILYGPKDSELKPLSPNLDLGGAGANLDRMLKQLEKQSPELALDMLRESGNLTAPGVRSAYKEGLDRVAEAQGNYDDGYIRAQKMQITISGYRNYDGYRSFNLDSFPDDVEFYVKERELVDDGLSKEQWLQALQSVNNLSPDLMELALVKLEVDAQDISAIVQERREAAERAEMERYLNSLNTPTNEPQNANGNANNPQSDRAV